MGLFLRDLEDVEREPLGRPAADSGQPRQLCDEILDGRAQHLRSVAVRCGHPPPAGYRERVRARHLASNWLWAFIVLALTGVVVWGWVFDFAV
jgi:hypothetical protein